MARFGDLSCLQSESEVLMETGYRNVDNTTNSYHPETGSKLAANGCESMKSKPNKVQFKTDR
jgi:hypothetical protein